MFPRDYYGRFDEIGDSYKDDEGLLHVELESVTEETRCQHCGSTNIKRIGFRKKEGFMDVTGEGAPVEITFRLQRYMCHDCTAQRAAETNEAVQKKIATTFTSNCLPGCIKKHGKISTDVVDTAIKKVARERVSIAAAAKSLHVSPGTVSKIIADQRDAALADITLAPPDVLIIYPFFYGKKERCAIIGVLEDRPMLYDILPGSTATSVRKYLTEKEFEGKFKPSTSLTDYPRPKMHSLMTELYEGTAIGILRESTFQRMKALRDQSWDFKTSLALDQKLAELGQILSAHFHDPESGEFFPIDELNDDFYEYLSYNNMDLGNEVDKSFGIMFYSWWDTLSEDMQKILKNIYDGIEANRRAISVALMYTHRQYDPVTLLQYIEKLKSNHVPFKDLMSWLMLAVGVYNKENISAQKMLSSSYVPQPIHGFYIDLNELNALLDT